MIEILGPSSVEAIERTPAEVWVGVQTVDALFAASARRHGQRPAIIWLADGTAGDTPVTVTYEALHATICGAAAWLQSFGVQPGDAVTLLLPNGPDTYALIWGAALAGIASPVNYLLSPEQIAAIMRSSGSRVLVTTGAGCPLGLPEKARRVADLLGPEVRVLMPPVPAGDAPQAMDPSAWLRGATSPRLPESRERDSVSCYLHTGGTTGTPKLARQTHWNQCFTAWEASLALGLRAADVMLIGLPTFHTNALIGTGLSVFYTGGTVLLCGPVGFRNKAMMEDFWRLVERFGVTMFSAVPTIYAALLERLTDEPRRRSLRYGICGAAPMPPSLFRSFEQRTGCRILEAYGMTEATAVSTMNPRDGERRIGSVGIRLPFQTVRVARLDATGSYIRDCEVNEVGTLLLGGPNLTPGYLDARHNANAWPLPGLFNSGDLGRRDADGYFWLAGRSKDLIIRSGHNIDPAMIEEALTSHPDVLLAAAVGRPDRYAGEVPIAFVQLRPGSDVDAATLLVHARSRVAEPPAAPQEVVVLESLPVTAVGKVFKPALRALAAKRALSSLIEPVAESRAFRCQIEGHLDDSGQVHLTASVAAPKACHSEIHQTLESVFAAISVPVELRWVDDRSIPT